MAIFSRGGARRISGSCAHRDIPCLFQAPLCDHCRLRRLVGTKQQTPAQSEPTDTPTGDTLHVGRVNPIAGLNALRNDYKPPKTGKTGVAAAKSLTHRALSH